jgi:PIN domain nuclease of toxin-antitoxin system
LPLAISLEHAEAVRVLPGHHRDPFDRILVAQATLDKLTIVTKDPLIERYDIDVVWDCPKRKP